MAYHRVAFVLQTLLIMLQMLVQNLQLLYHNRQPQVDMENYMLLKCSFGVFCGRSTAPLTGPAYVLQRLQRSRVDGHVS